MNVMIRDAKDRDIRAICEIYNYEVAHGSSNYAHETQTPENRREWWQRLTKAGFPVLVAEVGKEVLGFAALTPFHPLHGYRFTVTGSLYVSEKSRGVGVGRALCEGLLHEAKARGYHTVIAGVNSSNKPSIQLLKSFGFEQVGYFREIGQKNGEWFDDVCLQLMVTQR